MADKMMHPTPDSSRTARMMPRAPLKVHGRRDKVVGCPRAAPQLGHLDSEAPGHLVLLWFMDIT